VHRAVALVWYHIGSARKRHAIAGRDREDVDPLPGRAILNARAAAIAERELAGAGHANID